MTNFSVFGAGTSKPVWSGCAFCHLLVYSIQAYMFQIVLNLAEDYFSFPKRSENIIVYKKFNCVIQYIHCTTVQVWIILTLLIFFIYIKSNLGNGVNRGNAGDLSKSKHE